MATFLIILFGLLSGSLFSVLVGIIGSRRTIGFTWAFLISLIFTPIVGLIAVLLSNPRPVESGKKYGCIGGIFALFGFIFLVLFILALIGVLSVFCSIICRNL